MAQLAGGCGRADAGEAACAPTRPWGTEAGVSPMGYTGEGKPGNFKEAALTENVACVTSLHTHAPCVCN